jgi:recombinational DNA repair ATPase RecF
MRLLELEIHNVRGIPHLLLKPDGKNFVIWGPNGSGKSAVVDAIDFLLTGRISRLMGKGTGGISLSKHGPHVDHKPDEAIVQAVVQLRGIEKPVQIKRCMAHPNVLECDKSIEAQIKPIMTLAQRGQYVLTRREILKYITAEAGIRAQEIQDLLNIIEIENIRKALVKVQNDLDKELQTAKRAVGTAQAAVNATLQEKIFQQDNILRVVNQNRAVLGGQPISTLCSAELKSALTPPTVVSTSRAVNITLLDRDIQNLINVTSMQNREHIAKNDEELRRLITTIRSSPELVSALPRLELTKLGMGLIDDTGKCPLCDTPWPPGELRQYLEQRLSAALAATQYQERIFNLSDAIASSVNSTIASVQKVIAAAQIMSLDLPLLQPWLGDLQNLSNALGDPIEKYHRLNLDPSRVQQMLAPVNVSETLAHLRSVAKTKYPEVTPEQTAWDTLTRLEENLKSLENAENSFKSAELYQQRASILLESFQRARDVVLGRLYEDIKDRFVTLYRKLHGDDENNFAAKIEPEGAGLNLEVDFYGRGTHPPHALHSEGHQDSMGLCLYLTLAERLNQDLIDLVILDDVVMSVDADHRRQLCNLLENFFPDRQFLITTHDRTWANQLKSTGVVNLRETLEFRNWSVDTGPEVYYVANIMWDQIEAALKKGNIPSAAAQLRRGSEEFFGMVCDALQVPVTYKLSGLWELGDLLLPAMEKYRELIKKAHKVAFVLS